MLDASVCAASGEFRLINTHVDYLPDAAADQLDGLGQALGELDQAVLAGDLNLQPDHEAVSTLLSRTDSEDAIAIHDEGPTRGQRRVDYVLVSRDSSTAARAASRIQSEASDHSIVVVDVELGR